LGCRPTRTDLPDDALDLLDAAGRRIDVRGTQPRAKQVLTTEVELPRFGGQVIAFGVGQ
jgi:ATP-dependent Clp protease ATP-binding subunit ClpA